MKNQTKRVDDAIANSRNRKRQRNDEPKMPSPEELERAYVRQLMQVDEEVWNIIKPFQIRSAKQDVILNGDPLESPFRSHPERMKLFKVRYAATPLAQAMCEAYGKEFEGDPEVGNELPSELKVGDVIKLNIKSISKNGTVFSSGIYKENFGTRNNLAHFKKFAEFLPLEPVAARVIEVTPKITMVDLFGPKVEEFILPRTARPWIQNQISNQQPVLVKNLRLVKGGYLGEAVIPNISDWLGEQYVVEAFVPGSQIVLNTTEDFESHEGKSVFAFVMSYAPKPHGNGMSLVCSVKNYLKHQGHLNLMSIHGWWCEDGEKWKQFSDQVYEGTITGVINSSKKTGVFVEIPILNITGMINVPEDELVNYASGTNVQVRFKDFDEEQVYNDAVGQFQRLPAFEKVEGAIKSVNVKPIFELV